MAAAPRPREGLTRLLEREVAREPAPREMRTNARLFIFAQPVSADPRLLLDSLPDRNLEKWVWSLNDRPIYQRGDNYSPAVSESTNVVRRAWGVARSSFMIDPDRIVPLKNGDVDNHLSSVVDLEFREDGGLRLYYGRASDWLREKQYILGTAIVGEVAALIELAREVSAQAQFHGSWGFGVALRDIRSLAAYDMEGSRFFRGDRKFSEDGYDEVAEVDAITLHQPGSPVLDALVGRLMRATSASASEIHKLDRFTITPPEPESPPT